MLTVSSLSGSDSVNVEVSREKKLQVFFFLSFPSKSFLECTPVNNAFCHLLAYRSTHNLKYFWLIQYYFKEAMFR